MGTRLHWWARQGLELRSHPRLLGVLRVRGFPDPLADLHCHPFHHFHYTLQTQTNTQANTRPGQNEK